MATRTLDIGCGKIPKNPFSMDEVYGIDIKEDIDARICQADLEDPMHVNIITEETFPLYFDDQKVS